jgi:hypothetical protein
MVYDLDPDRAERMRRDSLELPTPKRKASLPAIIPKI